MGFDAEEITIIEQDDRLGRVWVCTAIVIGVDRLVRVGDQPHEIGEEHPCLAAPSTHRHLLLTRVFGLDESGPLGPGLRPVARVGPTRRV